MKFGPVSVRDAIGVILAHSYSTPPVADVDLSKGTILGPEHIAALIEDGAEQVVVAVLEDGDLHEDAAAHLLADALVPEEAVSLRRTDARTGRVNVYAQTVGVVRIDANALTRANSVNPMITVATLDDFVRLEANRMVATIKIISYGVPEGDVMRAAELLRGAIQVAEPQFHSASLVETAVPGQVFGEKGRKSLAMRMQRMGMDLQGEIRVPHEVDALAQALRDAQGDVLFILTGSATSDINDVAPMAVRAAGGEVHHYGIPVDPGNLLFLGQLGAKPVIGLPGCARSPALNGADWVMERVLCGINVDAADIAAMGGGGLLKEIPTRPRPRRSAEG